MAFVIGRGVSNPDEHPSGRIGRYRALDGSNGAPLYLDTDSPHAGVIVGKRGYGKSYTMGVIAEELARTRGVAPTVVDPMGVFGGVAEAGTDVPAEQRTNPTITADAIDPRSWCDLVGLPPESGAGSLVWQAASNTSTLSSMQRAVNQGDAPKTDRRTATNHLQLAAQWGIFDRDGLTAAELAGPAATVVDISGLPAAPMQALVRAIASSLYNARVTGEIDRLPWLLIDEAHVFFNELAEPALHRLLTRGRAPGVSLLLATQRPSAVSEVAISQSDLIVSHRLTAGQDIAALATAQPTYMDGGIEERLPTQPGEVLIIDDATESVHTARIRSRDTPHEGDSPKASAVQIEAEEKNKSPSQS